MKIHYRMVALATVIGLASGCTGARRFDRRPGDVRLPSAPVLEPNPGTTALDPDKIGTAGSPSPAGDSSDGVPMTPTMTPFGE